MYKVYWTSDDGDVHGREIKDLTEAIHFTHELRTTSPARFITMIGEDPNCTSLTGATGMKLEDYHWKKRRT